jgi:hypothetical protein
METVQTRYHEALLVQRARAWRKAVQSGAWQDWREHSEIHAQVMDSREVNRATS